MGSSMPQSVLMNLSLDIAFAFVWDIFFGGKDRGAIRVNRGQQVKSQRKNSKKEKVCDGGRAQE